LKNLEKNRKIKRLNIARRHKYAIRISAIFFGLVTIFIGFVIIAPNAFAILQSPLLTLRWSCNEATHRCESSSNGQFTSANICDTGCIIPQYYCDKTTYKCSQRTFVPANSVGPFGISTACTDMCINPNQHWSCQTSTGECVRNDAGYFADYLNCDEQCLPPEPDSSPPQHFSCVTSEGRCTSSDNGRFANLSSCTEACPAPARGWFCNENKHKCEASLDGQFSRENICDIGCVIPQYYCNKSTYQCSQHTFAPSNVIGPFGSSTLCTNQCNVFNPALKRYSCQTFSGKCVPDSEGNFIGDSNCFDQCLPPEPDSPPTSSPATSTPPVSSTSTEPTAGDLFKAYLNPATVTLSAGETQQLNVSYTEGWTGITVIYSSSNTKIATVNSDGLVKAVSEGSAAIVATVRGKNVDAYATSTITVNKSEPSTTPSSPLSSSFSVELFPFNPTIDAGKTLTFYAVSSYVGGGVFLPDSIVYESNAPSVATVSPNGLVAAKSEGYATITVTVRKGSVGVSAMSTLRVRPSSSPSPLPSPSPSTSPSPSSFSVELSPANSTIDIGKTQVFSTVSSVSSGIFSADSIAYKSSNPSVATVGSNGLVTGVSAGSATITVTVIRGSESHTASSAVTVSGTGIYYCIPGSSTDKGAWYRSEGSCVVGCAPRNCTIQSSPDLTSVKYRCDATLKGCILDFSSTASDLRSCVNSCY